MANNPKSAAWQWQNLFSPTVRANGFKLYNNLVPGDYTYESSDGGRIVHVRFSKTSEFNTTLMNLPTDYRSCLNVKNMTARDFPLTCTCRTFQTTRLPCTHIYVSLALRESLTGLFRYTQTAEEAEEEAREAERKRKEAEAEAKRRQEERRRIEEEQRRKEEERKKKLAEEAERKRREQALKDYKENYFGIKNVFNKRERQDESFFQPWLMTSSYYTTQYDVDGMSKVAWQDPPVFRLSPAGHNTMLIASGVTSDEQKVSIRCNRTGFSSVNCSCGRCERKISSYWYASTYSDAFCCHALALFDRLWDYVLEEDPRDPNTDEGERLRNALLYLGRKQEAAKIDEDAAGLYSLRPKVSETSSNNLTLSYSLYLPNGRHYIIRNLNDFLSAYQRGQTLTFTKNYTMDFSAVVFDAAGQKGLQMMEKAKRWVDRMNSFLYNQYSYYTVKGLSMTSRIDLVDSCLDTFYDIYAGDTLDYDRTPGQLTLKHAPIHISLTVRPILNKKQELNGIQISGTMPTLLRAGTHVYTLASGVLSRVSDSDMEMIQPFTSLTNSSGEISCKISKRLTSEFYYRLLPQLQQNPNVTLKDELTGKFSDAALPQPVFTYYVDEDEDRYTCTIQVAYDSVSFRLPASYSTAASTLRDVNLEKQAVADARTFFTELDREKNVFFTEKNEDQLYRLISDIVPLLEQSGTVMASSSIRGVRVSSMSRASVSVSLDSGILDLELISDTLSDDELLEILKSYQKKKRFYRLSSGDFIEFQSNDVLPTLDALLSGLHVSLDDVIDGKVKVPAFRAVYINELLEAHDDIASDRDRNFRTLVKNFKTIDDSDFEVPEEMNKLLRPYQVHGYKWLQTLAHANFGGILADDMGLGKTIQILALLDAWKQENYSTSSLVICPASVVFNWKNEAARFSPSLSVKTLTGTPEERRELVREIENGQGADLYVGSYEQVRRDIAMFKDVTFTAVILDEAQHIKNAKAGMTKAVKVLRSTHRYALTGTPIENRLSELWSIFDFLMPGFLYTLPEFTTIFDSPITRQHDEEATTRLNRMVGPFILRRLKEQVLKELPEKLEEVRTASFEAEQARLYNAQVVHMRQVIAESGNSGEDKLRILAEITRLRQICCDPSLCFSDYKGESAKRIACMDLVESAIDGGHRLLIFSQFTSMLALLQKDLEERGIDYYLLTGQTPKEERIRLMNAFNTGNTPVFLISLKAGGTGLNLTGADVVIHYDPWWNLAVQHQATDRAHRIGQTKKVTVYKLIAEGTIEEKILELQEAKKDLADAIISGASDSLMSLSREELLDLIS